MRQLVRRASALDTLLILWVLVAAVSILGASGTASLEQSTNTMLINLIVVVGLYVFIGNSGVFSFGHMTFMAIGAYAAALLMLTTQTKELLFPTMYHVIQGAHLPSLLAILAAGLVTAVISLVVGIPLMRLSGLNAAMGTLALLVIMNVVANNWQALTNASQGISGIPGTGFATYLVTALLMIAAAWLFQQTSTCLRLRATRDDEAAARSVGINVTKERVAGFCLSAFIVGIAGALFAQLQGAFAPDVFYLSLTFLTVAMLVVGGMTSLSGAVIGTLVLSITLEFLSRLEDGVPVGPTTVTAPFGTAEIVVSLVMLGILIKRPNGITGGRELVLPFTRSGSREPAA